MLPHKILEATNEATKQEQKNVKHNNGFKFIISIKVN